VQDLKAVQTEQIGPSQLERLQLAPGPGSNAAVIVALMNKDEKPIQTLTLGKKHLRKPTQQEQQFAMGSEGFPDGRYVLAGNDTKNALLISDPLSNIEPKPQDWLDRNFFKVERPKAIAVTFPVATNSWKIERDTESGDWKLADARPEEKLDAARASGVSSPFTPTLEDVVLPGAKPADNGLDKPTVLTVATFDDYVYTISIGTKTNENYPIIMTVVSDAPKARVAGKDEKPEDKDKADKAWTQRQKDLDEKLKQLKKFESWTFLVASWNVDPILKERKDLLEEKKEEPKPETKNDATQAKPDAAAKPEDPAASLAK